MSKMLPPDIYQKAARGTVDIKLQDGLHAIAQTALLTANQNHMAGSQFPGASQSLYVS